MKPFSARTADDAEKVTLAGIGKRLLIFLYRHRAVHPLRLFLAIYPHADSPGPAYYRGVRMGRYGTPEIIISHDVREPWHTTAPITRGRPAGNAFGNGCAGQS